MMLILQNRQTCLLVGPLLFIIFLTCFSVGSSRAHGLGYQLTRQDNIPTVTFHYSDGTSVSYAKVTVWSPDDSAIEYQIGRTDKKGTFSFVPNTAGIWKIKVSDGMGHATSAQITIRDTEKTIPPPTPNCFLSRSLSALLGVSLLFNVSATILYFRKQKHCRDLR